MKDLLPDSFIQSIEGEVHTSESYRTLYATDASLYFELPLAVVIPKNENDLSKLVQFAAAGKIPLIPRTAGTSLAGQVVGNGIVVDVSKYFRKILEINPAEKWVRVQPGVVRDELNQYLQPYGLMFCPETSTSNRCMIGGMIGNNSCGEHSLIYGTTRHHLKSVVCLLSNNSKMSFEALSKAAFNKKCEGNNLENKIYKKINEILSDKHIQQLIIKNYPDIRLHRRNMGYAIDVLLQSEIFTNHSQNPFNIAQLICGSEGTLGLITEAKLNLVHIPHEHTVILCAHFHKLEESFYANLIALEHKPSAVELIDSHIISGALKNPALQQNSFFISGNPEAVLLIEFNAPEISDAENKAEMLIRDLKKQRIGYHYVVVKGDEIQKVKNLRKAGLGILTNVVSETRPHSFVEDTAVLPEHLPMYISEFQEILKKHHVSCAYYGHISTGELHLKPILNLRTEQGRSAMRQIALETAVLVKKYRGSFSGEHGDGRLRGEFIELMLGTTLYNQLCSLKSTFDPENIFNPGKIIHSPRIDSSLREVRQSAKGPLKTYYDFSSTNGFLRAIERCNGSADCRKTAAIGGVMCPSYMATLDENHTTRARVNLMREILNHPPSGSPFANKELYEILDLCLMCKGCKSECPSGIDMSRYKAEFLQNYYNLKYIPVRTRLIAGIANINKIGYLATPLYNFFTQNAFFSKQISKITGFSTHRKLPRIYRQSLKKWAKNKLKNPENKIGDVYFFADEFTNYNDVETGKKAILLLQKLGYKVLMAPLSNSGRACFSKGMLQKASKIACKNIERLKNLITAQTPLIGIEPSAILSFRDEYPDIAGYARKETALRIAPCCFTIEEFICNEFQKGNITKEQFTKRKIKIKLHAHCHQKAITTSLPVKQMLSIPENAEVEEIPSGCCGMAGSFGYEKEHYDISMKIGELVLFPAVRNIDKEVIISAPGTSCRQQIFDGTGVRAFHPVEVLYDCLI